MAVEAARDCLGGLPPAALEQLILASTTHPYDDRQNAAIVANALHLGSTLARARCHRQPARRHLGADQRARRRRQNAGRRGRAPPGQGGEPAGNALRRRRRRAARRQRQADRAPRRVAQRNRRLRAPVPLERARPRLRLGRALDPRRGLHEARAGGARGAVQGDRRRAGGGHAFLPAVHAAARGRRAWPSAPASRKARCATTSPPSAATPAPRMRC